MAPPLSWTGRTQTLADGLQVRIVRSQRTNVPPSPPASSATVSVQSPFGSWPLKFENEPSGDVAGTRTLFT